MLFTKTLVKIFAFFLFPIAFGWPAASTFLRLASLASRLMPQTDDHSELARRPDTIPAPPVRPFGHGETTPPAPPSGCHAPDTTSCRGQHPGTSSVRGSGKLTRLPMEWGARGNSNIVVFSSCSARLLAEYQRVIKITKISKEF